MPGFICKFFTSSSKIIFCRRALSLASLSDIAAFERYCIQLLQERRPRFHLLKLSSCTPSSSSSSSLPKASSLLFSTGFF
ncbi:hypothetical protein CEXT_454591 [Caerostris extrusa]|uniref:Uncharacterized protein n=1 Tax=Caerostris extrusa TaxID=172846 RepID=A0AAV4N8N4_CAEEX|nr:hypothetical protein CEXT_454591 [Caerostris extrusa]